MSKLRRTTQQALTIRRNPDYFPSSIANINFCWIG